MDQNSINQEIVENLKNWKDIVKKYQVPDNKKAVVQLLTSFVPYLGLWVLMYFSLDWSIFITIGLGVINAFFLVRIFIIQHDCGHQSFMKSKRWNNVVGYACSVFSGLPYKYWARVHNFHHAHSGVLETIDIGDIPTLTVREFKKLSSWGRLKYKTWRNPFITFVIAPAYYIGLSNRLPLFRFKNWRKEIWNQFKNNVLIVGVYILLAYLVGWQRFLFVQLFLVFVFGIIAFWFFYIQHQHEHSYKQWQDNWNYVVSAIRGSSYYKLPKMWQWMTGNIGIHHIHHLSSLIPNYNLEKCMKENTILNKHVTVVTFWESLKMMSHKLWDEERQRMISFREYYRLEKMGMA